MRSFSHEDLEPYRDYLRVLARSQLYESLRGKADASDIVQQTFLQACASLSDFRGASQAELAGWLRQILINKLNHLIRSYATDKRDLARNVGCGQCAAVIAAFGSLANR